jgi:hypothetical protein
MYEANTISSKFEFVIRGTQLNLTLMVLLLFNPMLKTSNQPTPISYRLQFDVPLSFHILPIVPIILVLLLLLKEENYKFCNS